MTKEKPPILSKWIAPLEGKRLVMGVVDDTVSYRQAKEDGLSWSDEECTMEEWSEYAKRATRLK